MSNEEIKTLYYSDPFARLLDQVASDDSLDGQLVMQSARAARVKKVVDDEYICTSVTVTLVHRPHIRVSQQEEMVLSFQV